MNAFPSPVYAVPADLRDDKVLMLRNSGGMTLRDYFAAKALTGFLAAPCEGGLRPDQWARNCYEIADAMLKARQA